MQRKRKARAAGKTGVDAIAGTRARKTTPIAYMNPAPRAPLADKARRRPYICSALLIFAYNARALFFPGAPRSLRMYVRTYT